MNPRSTGDLYAKAPNQMISMTAIWNLAVGLETEVVQKAKM
jgi:hypothetical protein